VNRNGTSSVVVDHLDLPTSVDVAGDTAFITILHGEVRKVRHLSTPR
jgi:hypothetical protein